MALWTPEYIDTALWLDAADSSTITESGGAVSAWADKSGNGRNATQGENSLRPAVSPASVNGLNAITFVDDTLWLPSEITQVRAAIFVTHELTAPSSSVNAILGGEIANQDHVFVDVAKSFGSDISIDGSVSRAGGASVNGGTITSGTNIDLGLSTAQKQGTLIWYVEFDSAAAFRRIAELQTSNIYRGFGSLCELLLFGAQIDAGPRQKTEGYIAHKWGLTANLPADHPYKSAAPLAPYNISGTITGADGNPAARIVRVYNRSTGALLQETTSDATTGDYDFNFGTTDEVQRIVLADETALYNDIIDRVIPG